MQSPSTISGLAAHTDDVSGSTHATDISSKEVRVVSSVLKRCTDVVGATVGLVLSFPLIIIFGLLVYRESKGSILIAQTRIGRNDKPFTLYKLRTMQMDAEKDGVGWTVNNDPRILKIGHFIRRYNIDEVLQFWNVLKGDMSLVGPRPERPEYIQRFEKFVPNYHWRHAVRPGITGWAQVHGWRGDTDIHQRVLFDLDYIQNRSMILDIKIMWRTFFSRGRSQKVYHFYGQSLPMAKERRPSKIIYSSKSNRR